MSIQDSTENQIKASVDDALASQLSSACNEVLACIAWETFANACDHFGVDISEDLFDQLYPVYGEIFR